LNSLLKQLKKVDPLSYQAIDHRNRRRLIRALEVYKLTGQPFSQQQQTGEPRYQVLQLGLKMPRKKLYRRIDLRVEKMWRAGLLKETKKLLKKYPATLPSLSSIGYRESIAYLKGQLTLPEASELIKRNTHRYAKRQLTWFKRDRRIKWLTGPQPAILLVKKFLAN
jgi:tRNA dimethylallyltransferase